MSLVGDSVNGSWLIQSRNITIFIRYTSNDMFIHVLLGLCSTMLVNVCAIAHVLQEVLFRQ